MEVKPPKFAEAVVQCLLPAACVEHVLGDLQERMQGVEPGAARRRYVLDAITIMPTVIGGRVLRSVDVRLVCIYVAIQYGVFLALQHYIVGSAESLARIWWLTMAVVVRQLIEDASYPRGRVGAVVSFAGTLILYMGLLNFAAFTLVMGAVLGGGLLNLAHQWFEKHVAGPGDRRTS